MALSVTDRVEFTLAHLRAEGFRGVFKKLENTSAWMDHVYSSESDEALAVIQDWMTWNLNQSVIDDIESRLRDTELLLDEVARRAEDVSPLQAEQDFERRYFSESAVRNDQYQERCEMWRNEY